MEAFSDHDKRTIVILLFISPSVSLFMRVYRVYDCRARMEGRVNTTRPRKGTLNTMNKGSHERNKGWEFDRFLDENIFNILNKINILIESSLDADVLVTGYEFRELWVANVRMSDLKMRIRGYRVLFKNCELYALPFVRGGFVTRCMYTCTQCILRTGARRSRKVFSLMSVFHYRVNRIRWWGVLETMRTTL